MLITNDKIITSINILDEENKKVQKVEFVKYLDSLVIDYIVCETEEKRVFILNNTNEETKDLSFEEYIELLGNF